MSEYKNPFLEHIEDRLTCQACGFKGIRLPFTPARTSDQIVTETGSVWMVPETPGPPTAADWQAIDRQTSVVPRSGTCPFCGTNMPETAKITWGR